MKKHVKLFLDHHGYKAERFEDLFIPCNMCGGTATDIDHIKNRGMGGSKKLDVIENLQALCRPCHLNKTNEQIQ